MGKKSRTKGRSFEQLVADAYRQAWPSATVRRSLQAHQPFEPDVVIENHPMAVAWSECNHANDPKPLDKLAQAERDIQRRYERLGKLDQQVYLPIVVWRKTRGPINITTRLWVLQALGVATGVATASNLVVTLDFNELIEILRDPPAQPPQP